MVVKDFLNRIGRFPTYIRNGLILHKTLLLLRTLGLRIEPYVFYQEGPFLPRPSGTPADIQDFEFVRCGEESFPEIASAFPSTPMGAELRSRLAEGQRCYALKHGGKIAAFSWCETARIGFPPCRRPLGENEAYLFGAETAFEYRGHRLAPYLRYRCYEALREEGRTLVYSYSDSFNYPALRFKEKLGARILFTGLNLEIFGWIKKNWIVKNMTGIVEPPETRGG